MKPTVRTTPDEPCVVSITSSGQRLPVAARRLEALARAALAAEGVRQAVLSITFVTPRTMAGLNKRHLGHAGPTDIITFSLGVDPAGVLTADIYICLDEARRGGRAHGVGVREEVQRLVVHGVLHACGHDHPVDASRTSSAMWLRQEALLAGLTARRPVGA